MKKIVSFSGSLLLFTIVLAASANAVEYYDVRWPDKLAKKLEEMNYSPKEVSKAIYNSNNSCSKSIDDIDTKKAKICIKFSCGLFTYHANIDKYNDTLNIEQLSRCTWLD
ncbi:hypothetical protein GAY28_19125 [Azospirillum brasilense]|nr:hypothetical protein [Azospirillum brasilense]